MNQIDIHIRMDSFAKESVEAEVLANIAATRLQTARLLDDEKYMAALELTITALQRLKEFPDHSNEEFQAALVALIFDLAEIHFLLKDYKRSEKELDTLFKVLDPLLAKNSDRFGRLHILAMELSTRILRSRKKTIDLLARQQLNVDALTEKVNSVSSTLRNALWTRCAMWRASSLPTATTGGYEILFGGDPHLEEARGPRQQERD